MNHYLKKISSFNKNNLPFNISADMIRLWLRISAQTDYCMQNFLTGLVGGILNEYNKCDKNEFVVILERALPCCLANITTLWQMKTNL